MPFREPPRAGRLSFAPESCLKGPILLDLIGGKSHTKGRTERDPSRRFDGRLERWAAETCARLLQVRDVDAEAFLVLTR